MIRVRHIAVLDRTKEPGAIGEPLYQDVVTALVETGRLTEGVRVIGGRYGLSSKEFTPAMAARVFDELKADQPKRLTPGRGMLARSVVPVVRVVTGWTEG